MTERLQGAARIKALGELEGWADVPGRDAITKTFRYKNFRQAFDLFQRLDDRGGQARCSINIHSVPSTSILITWVRDGILR